MLGPYTSLLWLVLLLACFTYGQQRIKTGKNFTKVMDIVQSTLHRMYPLGPAEVLKNRAVLLNTNNSRVIRKSQIASRQSAIKSCDQLRILLELVKPLTFDERVKVYLVKDAKTNASYIWKVFRDHRPFYRELEMIMLANHPSIVRAVCIQEFREAAEINPGIVVQLIKGEASSKYFDSIYPGPASDEIIQFAARVYDAIKYIHWVGYTHGDLRTGHILHSASGTPTLIDFEESVKLPNHNRHIPNSELTAPELVYNDVGPSHENIDMWAFGMALARWNYRKFDMDSWKSDSKSWFFVKIKEKELAINTIPDYFSTHLRQVLYYCLNPIPQMRRFNTREQQELFEALPYWENVDWFSLRSQWDSSQFKKST